MGFPRRSTPRRWHGIGHPTTVEALTRLDVEIQRIQDGLADAGLLDITNIWVASDHGFSQHTGSVDLGALLTPFADTLDDGSPRIVAGAGAIYVRDDDQTLSCPAAGTLRGGSRGRTRTPPRPVSRASRGS